jgi:hypothetical protein
MSLLKDLILLQWIFHIAILLYDTSAMIDSLLIIGTVVFDGSRSERHVCDTQLLTSILRLYARLDKEHEPDAKG